MITIIFHLVSATIAEGPTTLHELSRTCHHEPKDEAFEQRVQGFEHRCSLSTEPLLFRSGLWMGLNQRQLAYCLSISWWSWAGSRLCPQNVFLNSIHYAIYAIHCANHIHIFTTVPIGSSWLVSSTFWGRCYWAWC